MRVIVLIIALCLLPISASAQSTDPAGTFSDVSKTVTVSSAAFTTLAMNTTRTTDAIKTQGFRYLTFNLVFDRTVASAVTMTCTHAATSDGTYRTIKVGVYSGYVFNTDTKTWSEAVSGDENWSWTVTLRPGYNYLKCTFSATSGGASDLLSVTAVAREG